MENAIELTDSVMLTLRRLPPGDRLRVKLGMLKLARGATKGVVKLVGKFDGFYSLGVYPYRLVFKSGKPPKIVGVL